MKKILSVALWTGLLTCSLAGQSSNTLVGGGFAPAVPLTVAPGEVLTVFVQGIGARLFQRVVATSLPLPTNLAGISVTLKQTISPQTVSVPLFAVFPVSTCVSAQLEPCGRLIGITLQIPFELRFGIGPVVNIAQLVVSENGVAGNPTEVRPFTDQIHILRLGEIMTGTGSDPTSIVTHADGKLVTESNPAAPGEMLVLWALGIGPTSPPSKSGEAAPTPPPTADLVMTFDYRPNAGPSSPPLLPAPLPLATTAPQAASPVFSGLAPGFVGLYQVNFIVPDPPSGTQSCGPGIGSNLTVNIGRSMSFDGARICVRP